MPQVFTYLATPNQVRSADGFSMPVWVKDPYDVEDFTIDFSVLLASNLETGWTTGDDTIAALTVVVSPGAEVTVLSTNFTDTQATAWLQGGVLNETYNVAYQITTADGREFERSWQLVLGQN